MEPGMVKLKLKQTDLVRYSPLEKALFEIIRSHRGTPLNTAKLAEKFYDGEIPLNGRTIISVTINALIKKTRWNKEEFKVCRSPRSGPNSTTVWIEHNA
jgi:hypothetical protein